MSLSPPVATSPLPASPVSRSSSARDEQLPLSKAYPSSPLPHSKKQARPRNPAKKTDIRRSGQLVQGAATPGQQSLQLSERESIFALHYTPSQDELSPSNGEGAPALSSRNDNGLFTEMEVAQPLSSVLPTDPVNTTQSVALRQTHKPTHHRPYLNSTGQEDKSASFSGIPQGKEQGIRRVASEGLSWTKRVPLPVSKSGMSQQRAMESSRPPRSQEMKQQGVLEVEDTTSRKSLPSARSEDLSEAALVAGQRANVTPKQDVPPQSLRQALQGPRSERSMSRGRSHIEKRIEATFANVEPGKNVRSRKASHAMGIFRENASPEDNQRPLFRRPKDFLEPEERDQIPNSASKTTSPSPILPTDDYFTKTLSTPLLDDLKPLQSPGINTTPVPSDVVEAEVQDLPKSGPSTPTLRRRSEAASPFRPSHDPYYRKHDLLKSTKDLQSIPPGLLQQIREHSILPIRPQNVTTANEIDQTSVPDPNETLLSKKQPEETEKHHEDEEHLYKMVYYPHPGPTAEEIAKFKSPGDESPEIEPLESLSPLARDPTGEPPAIQDSDSTASEHIDISVHSKHGKSVFHGDYYPTKEEDEKASTKPLLSIKDQLPPAALSTSDSEPESGDEFGNTSQEDETTPTATPRQPSHLLDRKKVKQEGPKGAVVLQPYNHQVGGHSQIYALTKRAIMKQLNNKENEFYETVEKNHPDMLKFLPRYIGVMNVSFSKVPKHSKSASTDMSSGTNGGVNGEESSTHPHRSNMEEISALPRIVSKSQAEVGEVPQIILNQNRHIVPFGLFATPERPRSAEPRQSHDSDSLALSANAHHLRGRASGQSPNTLSSLRPPPPEHSPSWGTTTVNGRLREQVLSEVFGPTPIQRRKRHAPSHSTIQRPREPNSRRRSNLSGTFNASNQAHEDNDNDVEAGSNTSISNGNETVNLEEGIPKPDKYSSSASVFEDVSHALGKTHTTTDSERIGFLSDERPKIRRRHSGMNLRRRRKSVSGDEKVDLEYFAEDVPGEEEVFSMDNESVRGKRTFDVPATVVPQELFRHRSPADDSGEERQHYPVRLSNETNLVPVNGMDPESMPLNPKDAQIATATAPDEKVVYFLLLENLTYGMGRPCVLDLKMGTRQYGVEADKKKMESQRRKCKTTTSQQLGVRVCGMQSFNAKTQQASYEDKYFGRDLKAGREFRETLIRFLYDGVTMASVARHIPTILHMISKLENMVRRLPGYRFYASSLLMIYDAEPEKSEKAKEEEAKASKNGVTMNAEKPKERKNWPPPIELKLVDFANCVAAETGLPATAKCPPQHPHDIDRGYLRGLRTLKMYFQRILRDINQEHIDERGEGEGTFAGGQDVTHHATHDEGSEGETDDVSI